MAYGVSTSFVGVSVSFMVGVQHRLREAKVREMEQHQKGLGGLMRSTKAFQGLAKPFPTPSGAPPPQARLSSKDIVGGVAKFDESAEKQGPPPAGPVKKGKWWNAYQAYLKEAEEDQRRKLELWARKEEERKREAMANASSRP